MDILICSTLSDKVKSYYLEPERESLLYLLYLRKGDANEKAQTVKLGVNPGHGAGALRGTGHTDGQRSNQHEYGLLEVCGKSD